jgi:peptidoglycan/LPS O-acetylase OafA/YrhL
MVRASLDSSDPQRPAPLPYRGEIDGLRAVAVMSVVLYHFGAPIPGGFTGVDIFFVISGFLIGSILWREYIQTGTIGLWDFYQRRFRRLAPAFFVMLAATSLAGWVLVLPFEYREYGKTVIAATLYLSNVCFFGAPAISTRPLRTSRCCIHGLWRSRNNSTLSCPF